MPKYSEEELRKMYEQVYKSHKISEIKKNKKEVQDFKRKGRYDYEQ